MPCSGLPSTCQSQSSHLTYTTSEVHEECDNLHPKHSSLLLPISENVFCKFSTPELVLRISGNMICQSDRHVLYRREHATKISTLSIMTAKPRCLFKSHSWSLSQCLCGWRIFGWYPCNRLFVFGSKLASTPFTNILFDVIVWKNSWRAYTLEITQTVIRVVQCYSMTIFVEYMLGNFVRQRQSPPNMRFLHGLSSISVFHTMPCYLSKSHKLKLACPVETRDRSLTIGLPSFLIALLAAMDPHDSVLILRVDSHHGTPIEFVLGLPRATIVHG